MIQAKKPTIPPVGGRVKILAEATNSGELCFEDYRIRALLSSPGSGAGKTTAACSLPGRKLLLDIDNRKESIAGWPLVETIECFEEDSRSPKAWMRLEKIKRELWSMAKEAKKKGEEFPYDGIIVDGNTALFRVCMNWSLLLDPKHGLGGSPAQQHYGPQMKNASDWILSILGLPCHVIFTGHEDKVEQDGGQLACWLPKVTGKLCTEVPKWFNETYFAWRNEVSNEGEVKHRFFWSTQGSGRRDYLKSSMNQLGRYWKDPIEIDFSKEFVGFGDILRRRFGDQLSAEQLASLRNPFWESKSKTEGGG